MKEVGSRERSAGRNQAR